MIANLKFLYNSSSDDSQITNYLSFGRDYIVVGIDDENIRVINDIGDPALYPKSIFNFDERDIPRQWKKREYSDGEYHITPLEFSSPGFFEDYFDGNEDAVRVFDSYIEGVLKRGRM